MKRSRIIVFILLGFVAFSITSCYQYLRGRANNKDISTFTTPAPDSAFALSRSLDEYEDNYENEDGVYLDYDYTVEMTGSLGQTRQTKLYKLRFLILKPDEEWITTFRLSYDRNVERVDSLYVQITNPDGSVRRYGRRDMKFERDSDGQTTVRFAYPDITKGSIVEEGYMLRTPNNGHRGTNFYHALQYRVPCENMSYKFIYPKTWALQIKKTRPDSIPPHRYATDSAAGKQMLIAERTNIPAYKREPYSPNRLDVSEYLQFMITDFSESPYYPVINWEKIAKATSKHFTGTNGKRYLRRFTDDLLEESGARTQREKITTIINYVKNNVRSDGKKSVYDFDDIIDGSVGNQYSVCDLTRRMLDHIHVSSEIAILHNATDGYFDRDFVSPDQMYRFALNVEIDGETFIVFPTVKNLPIGMIPPEYEDQWGMFFKPEGTPRFEQVGKSKSGNNRIREHYNVRIDEDGILHVTETKEFSGILAYVYREVLDKKEEDEELEDFLKDLLTYDETQIKLDDYTFRYRDQYDSNLVMTFSYKIDNLVTVTPDEVLFQTDGLFAPSSLRQSKLGDEERIHPIEVQFEEYFDKNIDMSYPREWNLTTTLKNIDQENEIGSIRATYTNSPGTLSVAQTRRLFKGQWPKETIDRLVTLHGSKSKLAIPTLVFSQ